MKYERSKNRRKELEFEPPKEEVDEEEVQKLKMKEFEEVRKNKMKELKRAQRMDAFFK